MAMPIVSAKWQVDLSDPDRQFMLGSLRGVKWPSRYSSPIGSTCVGLRSISATLSEQTHVVHVVLRYSDKSKHRQEETFLEVKIFTL